MASGPGVAGAHVGDTVWGAPPAISESTFEQGDSCACEHLRSTASGYRLPLYPTLTLPMLLKKKVAGSLLLFALPPPTTPGVEKPG